MNAIVWIILCLFAAAGLVQCVGWIICNRRKPRCLRRGYHAIPMYDDTEELEAQLRYCLSQIQWSGRSGEMILLVDMGLSEESLEICEEFLQRGGFLYCKSEHLADTIRDLDGLQLMQE